MNLCYSSWLFLWLIQTTFQRVKNNVLQSSYSYRHNIQLGVLRPSSRTKKAKWESIMPNLGKIERKVILKNLGIKACLCRIYFPRLAGSGGYIWKGKVIALDSKPVLNQLWWHFIAPFPLCICVLTFWNNMNCHHHPPNSLWPEERVNLHLVGRASRESCTGFSVCGNSVRYDRQRLMCLC